MVEMQKQITLLSQETVVKIARRTGSIFNIHDSLEEQFKNIKLRGYLEHKENSPIPNNFECRNPFAGFDTEKSRTARLAWIEGEKDRMKQRKIRLLKKKKEEKKMKKEEEKKKNKKVKKNKRKRRIKTGRGRKSFYRKRKLL